MFKGNESLIHPANGCPFGMPNGQQTGQQTTLSRSAERDSVVCLSTQVHI
jgi:hypothetical protein